MTVANKTKVHVQPHWNSLAPSIMPFAQHCFVLPDASEACPLSFLLSFLLSFSRSFEPGAIWRPDGNTRSTKSANTRTQQRNQRR